MEKYREKYLTNTGCHTRMSIEGPCTASTTVNKQQKLSDGGVNSLSTSAHVASQQLFSTDNVGLSNWHQLFHHLEQDSCELQLQHPALLIQKQLKGMEGRGHQPEQALSHPQGQTNALSLISSYPSLHSVVAQTLSDLNLKRTPLFEFGGVWAFVKQLLVS